MIEARFDYAGPFKTLVRADEAMADLYANGEICDGENPLIQGRKVRVVGGARSEYRVRYYITLSA